MAINQQTAAIKARMDRIPAALSPELVERIAADRASGVDQVIRRVNRAADEGTLMRPAFMRDIEKILHLPAYTRYAGKTQVFSFRSNDDLSRRGLHVQLVSRIARDIGRALGLNCDLIEAIGLGHDLGHTPFGHAGERFLNDIYHLRTGRYFFHNVQSVRVLDALYGRNVSLQTLDGVRIVEFRGATTVAAGEEVLVTIDARCIPAAGYFEMGDVILNMKAYNG